MIMSMLLARIRLLVGSLALLMTITAVAPSAAQQRNADGTPNPTASAVDEQTLLREFPRVEGRIDIPNPREAVLIQPAGRTWDYFHEVILHWFGAIVILGMIAVLAIGYLIIGRIRISNGRSGTKIPRFNGFERFSHWLTAVSFVVLGLTGLNITFGKILLLPVLGPDRFSDLSQACKYVHNFVSFSFVIGFILIVELWIKDNIPRQVDVTWLKEGGGFIKSKNPPAGRFNAGEKLVFWLALAAGASVIVSGYFLMFPFYLTDIAGMQIAQVVHAVIALLFISLILAHIYIGTLGMEGAFEAMAEGTVDLNWAKEHHSLWFDEMADRAANEIHDQPSPAPAE
jgi:formate dehydrogenase subunit gamma